MLQTNAPSRDDASAMAAMPVDATLGGHGRPQIQTLYGRATWRRRVAIRQPPTPAARRGTGRHQGTTDSSGGAPVEARALHAVRLHPATHLGVGARIEPIGKWKGWVTGDTPRSLWSMSRREPEVSAARLRPVRGVRMARWSGPRRPARLAMRGRAALDKPLMHAGRLPADNTSCRRETVAATSPSPRPN